MMRPGVPIRTSTPAASTLALFVVIRAAEREAELERQVLAKRLRVGVNLHGELASRRQDQRTRRRRTGLRRERRVVLEPMEQREQEGGGLARSRLRLAGHVLAVERKRQRLALDRRAVNEAGFGDSLLQPGRQREVGES